MRLYELAKEMKMTSKELQEKLNTDGYDYKNRLNSVSPEAIDKMRTLYGPLPDRLVRRPPTAKKKRKPRTRGRARKEDKPREKKPAAKDKPRKADAPPAKKGPPPTVRKIADLPPSVTKGADGKIQLPAAVAKLVKKKVALPPHKKIKDPKKVRAKSKARPAKDAKKIGVVKTTAPAVDYSKFKVEEETKPKTPAVAPADREKHRRRNVDWFAGKAVRVVMPSRRGRDRGKQHGVIVRRKGRGRGLHAGKQRREMPPEFKRPEKIDIAFPVTVRDLSAKIGVKAPMILKKLIEQEIMVTVNDHLGEDVAAVVALEFGTELVAKEVRDYDKELKGIEETPDKPEDLRTRAPVVAFLGHVDLRPCAHAARTSRTSSCSSSRLTTASCRRRRRR
jgi:translation initiation factor IF-2